MFWLAEKAFQALTVHHCEELPLSGHTQAEKLQHLIFFSFSDSHNGTSQAQDYSQYLGLRKNFMHRSIKVSRKIWWTMTSVFVLLLVTCYQIVRPYSYLYCNSVMRRQNGCSQDSTLSAETGLPGEHLNRFYFTLAFLFLCHICS